MLKISIFSKNGGSETEPVKKEDDSRELDLPAGRKDSDENERGKEQGEPCHWGILQISLLENTIYKIITYGGKTQ